MADPSPAPDAGRSWTEDRLARLEAVYRRYGRDGLREFPMADVRLLLTSRELAFRDASRGPAPTDTQRADNRRLELEIADLRAFLQAEITAAGRSTLQQFVNPHRADHRPQIPKPKDRDREPER